MCLTNQRIKKPKKNQTFFLAPRCREKEKTGKVEIRRGKTFRKTYSFHLSQTGDGGGRGWVEKGGYIVSTHTARRVPHIFSEKRKKEKKKWKG